MKTLPLSICTILVGAALTADAGESADALVRASGVKAGLCLHLGVTDGEFTAALGRNGRFLVHGLSADRGAVAKARAHIAGAGRYGRVSVEYSALKKLPYADGLANLLVVSSATGGVDVGEIARVLAPNGVACFKGQAPKVRGLRPLKSAGGWSFLTKPLPAGSSEWTHHNYDTSGNRVSKDILAGPPQRVRWISGVPWRMPDYKAKSMVVGGGRMYYVINEGAVRRQQWPYLSVRDAFSGVLLWKRAGAPVPLTMIAAGEKLYMSSGPRNGTFIAVDGATGKLLKTYEAAAGPRWAMLHGNNLLVSCGRTMALKNLDPETGKVRWVCSKRSFEPGGGLTNAAVLDGKIFYAERRKGNIGCLDLATGAEKWHKNVKDKGGMLCAVGEDTMILYNRKGINAFSTADGRHLWSHTYEVLGSPTRRKAKCFRDVFFIDGLCWTHVGDIDSSVPTKYKYLRNRKFSWQGLDPTSGKVRKTFPYPKGVQVGASCFPDQASVRYFMGGYSEYVDVKTGKHQSRAEGLHTSCAIGLRVAYGLTYNSALYMPGRFLQGDMAVESGMHETSLPPADASRLERGPAYDRVSGSGFRVPGDGSWPTYRHDGLRTSRTPAKVPAQLKELWSAKVGAGASASTIAAGKVFVASAGEHKVMAFDGVSGKSLWSFTTGGRVKVPPTYYKGACFFGSGDGYVYCLDATSGKLAWRFRGARTSRRIVARGRVESTWPVDEGVTVSGGKVCFAAGRHGQVDGGIDLYALDCASGKLSWHKRLTGGYYPSLLAAEGQTLALGPRERFGLKDGNKGTRLTIPATAYSRARIDPAHVIGKTAIVAARLRALIRAGEIVFAAGQPDAKKAEAPRILWQKPRRGGEVEDSPAVHPLAESKSAATGYLLWAFSATDGKKLSELKLPAKPAWDGMAAANGRLYVTTEDGKLRCFGKK
jgi:outer membrane protein assembly factor BamB